MIYLSSDYAGYPLRQAVAKYLGKKKLAFTEWGATDGKTTDDFTDYVPPVATAVRKSSNHVGILICGTGYGMAIAANRFRGIRATLVFNTKQAAWAKTHDNANVLCLSAWSLDGKEAGRIINKWLTTKFQPYARRVRRFKKIDQWPR